MATAKKPATKTPKRSEGASKKNAPKTPRRIIAKNTAKAETAALKAPLYGEDGALKGDVVLPAIMFNAKIRPELMHRMSLMQHSNGRRSIAHTLTKGEVRGGGRKPYRQKGTGNARQGSIRNPHYKGGGVTFGPRSDRNWQRSMPRSARRQALFSALTVKAQKNKILALEDFTGTKTKAFAALLTKLPVERDVLFVLPGKKDNAYFATRNIPYVKTILAAYLNVNDILSYHNILFLSSALKKTEEIFSTPKGA